MAVGSGHAHRTRLKPGLAYLPPPVMDMNDEQGLVMQPIIYRLRWYQGHDKQLQ